MTKYYTHKSDFDAGNISTWMSNWTDDNGQTITNLLDNIKTVTKSVKENDATSFYKQVGDAELGRNMPKGTYTTSYEKIMKMMESARRIHEEVVLRIDRKYTKGLDESMTKANNINSGENTYETKHLSYQKKVYRTYRTPKENGGFTENKYDTGERTTEHYSLDDLISNDKSPIKATKVVYSAKVDEARARFTKESGRTEDEIKKARQMSDDEFIGTYIEPQNVGYEQLRATQWQEDYKESLDMIQDVVVPVVSVVALVASGVGMVASGGTAAPILAPIATATSAALATYSTANAASVLATGSDLAGRSLDTSEQVFAVGSAIIDVASLGSSQFLTSASKTKTMIEAGELAGDINKATKAYTAAQSLNNVADTAGLGWSAGEIGYNKIVKNEDPSLLQVAGVGVGLAGKYVDHVRPSSPDSTGTTTTRNADLSAPRQTDTPDFSTSNRLNHDTIETDTPNTPHVDVDGAEAGVVGAVGAAAVSQTPNARVADVEVPTRAGEVTEVAGAEVPNAKVEEVASTQGNRKEMPAVEQRSHVLKNIEESRKAREASNFDNYLRQEYHSQGKYFPERVDLPNGKRGYLSADTFDGKLVPVRSREFVDAEGSIKWPPKGTDGFVVDETGAPITEPANLKAGQVIDRYGSNGGRFTSPVENGKILGYNTRGLPYPEGYQTYHQYEVVKDINKENIEEAFSKLSDIDKIELRDAMRKFDFTLEDMASPQKGQIAKVFGQGGGVQVKFGTSVEWYERLGLLKEVK